MRTSEIAKNIKELKTANTHFIGWWRKEEDFIDYDLIDRFLDNAQKNEDVGGYQLLTTEEMWQRLRQVCDDRVMKTQKAGDELLEWTVGGERKTLPFTPESIMDIFDAETKGDVID